MSTISRRIETAIKHLIDKDYENALIQISIAVDATAKRKWQKLKVGERIKKFIKENEAFIYQTASSGGLFICQGGGLIMQGKELPEIIYKLIRCTLQHGDELSDYIIIKESFNTLGVVNNKIIINTGHIYGLLFSVIFDPINNMEKCVSQFAILLHGKYININDF